MQFSAIALIPKKVSVSWQTHSFIINEPMKNLGWGASLARRMTILISPPRHNPTAILDFLF